MAAFEFNTSLLIKYLDQEFDKIIVTLAKMIVETAKKEHRYKNRSGKLTKSIDWYYNHTVNQLQIYASAKYAQYVIRGHGTWRPDPFIENAIKKHLKHIDDILQKAANKAIERFNKG